ncbi:MAG: 30S ribosomal protein S3 [Clostridia bacterium]|nr:30S ribosomal protein S3 [Clostridia bacterium]
MGQKVNPHGLRVGVIKDWDSRWFAGKKEFGDQLVEDYNIRKFVKKACFDAGVSKIGIERKQNRVFITINAAKPGLIIGRGGEEINKLKAQIEKLTDKTVNVNIMEVKSPDTTAQLVAENIAAQLERRISFRRAMKQTMSNAMRRGVKGIKTTVSGRVGGAEIARSESYHEGTIPLQTLRADIDYGFAEAKTTYGILGVKVWIYKGEILNVADGRKKEAEAQNAPSDNRRDNRRNNRRGQRGNGERRPNNGNRRPKGGNE